MKANLLLGKMAEKGITRKDLAEKLGLSISAVYNKLAGRVDFTCSEIREMTALLDLDPGDTMSIFFNPEVS